MIRATYGHSVEIELDLPTDNIPPPPSSIHAPDEAENLLEVGISPSGRSHVHLSATVRSAAEAGKVHHNSPSILEVDTASMVASAKQYGMQESLYTWRTQSLVNISAFYPLMTQSSSLARAKWGEEE